MMHDIRKITKIKLDKWQEEYKNCQTIGEGLEFGMKFCKKFQITPIQGVAEEVANATLMQKRRIYDNRRKK